MTMLVVMEEEYMHRLNQIDAQHVSQLTIMYAYIICPNKCTCVLKASGKPPKSALFKEFNAPPLHT